MKPTPEIVRNFHAAYCRETDLPVSLGFDRQRSWDILLSMPFGDPPASLTIGDLELVIRYLRKGIAKGDRNPGCLRFRNLIEQPDYFEEELAMARKVARLRQRPAARQEATTVAHPDGGSVTRMEQHTPQHEPVEASAEAERFMVEFRRRKARHQSKQ